MRMGTGESQACWDVEGMARVLLVIRSGVPA